MERKSKVLLLFTIFSLFLVGLYLVNAAHTFTSKDSSLNTSNEGRGLTRDVNKNFSNLQFWTLFNATEIFNFTINATGADNVYKINITAPSGIAYNISNAQLNFANVTSNGTDFNWTFFNTSYINDIRFELVGARNTTGINMTGNITTVWVNYTALFGGERIFTWNVTTWDVLNVTSSQTFTTGIDGSAPRANANTTNLTQSHSALPLARTANFDATTYLRNDTEINITITVTDYNLWKVLLLYNNSGGTVNITNISNGQQYNDINLSGNFTRDELIHRGDNADFLVMKDMVTNSPNVTGEVTKGTTPANAPSYVFRATLSAGNFSSDGTPVTFAFVVFDLYNQSAQVNNSNAVFRFIEDGLAPTVSITAPDDTSIATSSSTGIKYICLGSDSNNSIASYSWTLTKPGGETVTKTTATVTFSLTDIDKAGTYDLKCTVTDQVGNDAVSSNYQFTAHVTSSSSSGGSPGGGGGTGTAQPKLENDLSVSETVTITKQQGRIVSFSLDGQNVHKMTFKEVTASKVTLVLESTPVEVTLEIGESKKVDLDEDGTDDIEVTLVSIKNGLAEVITKKLATPTADTTTTTTIKGVTTTTVSSVQPGAGEGAGGSKAWLWVILIIVVIVVVVYFVKRKKR